MEKKWKNESGDLVVRPTANCGIVEILHLWDKESESGCAIGYWEKRQSDGTCIAEFKSVHDRIMTTNFDEDYMLLEILKYGQRLADLIIDSDKPPTK